MGLELGVRPRVWWGRGLVCGLWVRGCTTVGWVMAVGGYEGEGRGVELGLG